MKATEISKNFAETVSRWQKKLLEFSSEEFNKKPNHCTWSVSQIYEHVTSSTINFHVKQIEVCLSDGSNKNKRKTFIGSLSLLINRIPPVEIKIPPEENIEPLQYQGKQLINERLQHLKEIFTVLSVKIDAAETNGKTNHPGMGYLNAKEWFQLIELHFHYHERDIKKIKNYFDNNMIVS